MARDVEVDRSGNGGPSKVRTYSWKKPGIWQAFGAK